MPPSGFGQSVRGVCVSGCDVPSGGGGSGGSGVSIWDLFRSPEPTIDPQQENRNTAVIKNKAGNDAWQRGDVAGAVALYEEAAKLWPDDKVIADNLRRAREQLQAQREEEQRRASMQQGLSRMADILNNMQPVVTPGLDFDGGSRGATAGSPAGGLDFMPATPTQQAASAPKPAADSGCGVNTDPSVVDLCGMGNTLVVDPAKLKAPAAVAGSPQPPDPSVAAAKRELDRQMDELFETVVRDAVTARRIDLLYDAIVKQALTEFSWQRRWPGPVNPNPRLINPLTEPQRYEAWKKSIDARLKIQAQEGKNAAIVEHMSRDPAINAARDRIVKKQEEAEHKAFTRAQSDMQAALEKLRKEANLKDFAAFQKKEQDDPNLRAKVKTTSDAIVQRWEREQHAARSAAIQEMTREIDKWQSAQAAK
jgi:hypothetical protein